VQSIFDNSRIDLPGITKRRTPLGSIVSFSILEVHGHGPTRSRTTTETWTAVRRINAYPDVTAQGAAAEPTWRSRRGASRATGRESWNPNSEHQFSGKGGYLMVSKSLFFNKENTWLGN
jgi:hypothetical protein